MIEVTEDFQQNPYSTTFYRSCCRLSMATYNGMVLLLHFRFFRYFSRISPFSSNITLYSYFLRYLFSFERLWFELGPSCNASLFVCLRCYSRMTLLFYFIKIGKCVDRSIFFNCPGIRKIFQETGEQKIRTSQMNTTIS